MNSTTSPFSPKPFNHFVQIIVGFGGLLLGQPTSSQAQTSLPDPVQVMATHCLECHSSTQSKGDLNLSHLDTALSGGKSGPAIIPGNPDMSLIWTHISNGEMPPKPKPRLSSLEIDSLRQWILSGARYPQSGTIDPFQYTSPSRAGYQWWSLQPIIRPHPPVAENDSWSRNEIDPFILAQLQNHQLSPSPEAAPLTLAKRLYHDLIGLPPDLPAIQFFLDHPSEINYLKLVDKLLAHPGFGERWARHWLDIARFGESDGFERNMPREHQWPYRDWVIQALGKDLPYPEFVRWQMIGDLISPNSEGFAAVSFLTAGVHNTVVGGSEFMKRTARQDELEEIIGAVSQSFLGLTLNCARCHDHKFDPIRQDEYYRFASALNGVYHGERPYRDPTIAKQASDLQQQILTLTQKIHSLEIPARARLAKQKISLPHPSTPTPTYEWTFDHSIEESNGKLPGHAKGNPSFHNGAIQFSDDASYAETAPLPMTIRAKTLEAVVQVSTLDQQGGAVVALQSRDGQIFDAIVYGEREARKWMAGSDFFKRSQHYSGLEESEAHLRPVHLTIVYHESGRIERYRNGIPYGEPYTAPLQEFPANDTVIRFGIRHLPPDRNKIIQGEILHARFYDRALTPEEVNASAELGDFFIPESALLQELSPEDRDLRSTYLKKIHSLQQQLTTVSQKIEGTIYTVTPQNNPGTTRILLRGQAMNEGEIVAPGGLQCLSTYSPDFNLPPDAPEGDRRNRLAEWITHPQNPLPYRVIVNRIWHYYFGKGLVETPSDFGFNAGTPSHPQLLDWLASEVQLQNGSLKAIHRLIVTSSTYRQSSRPNPQGQQQDSSNRFLWRRTPTRLDAETLRDSMLSVAGLLNPEQFGPGFKDVHTQYLDGTTYYTPFDSPQPDLQRRTIYRFSPRGGRNALLDTFDCPDPANAAPRRSSTSTPLQALSLLNNDFSLRVANHLAERIQNQASQTNQDPLETAFLLTLLRKPTSEERQISSQLIQEHDLASLARVLLNSNEFVIIE